MIATIQSIVELSGGRMINCVLAGLLIALLAWAALRVTNCRNSGMRFAVWFSALLAIAGLSFMAIPVGGNGFGVGVRVPHITLPASWLWFGFLIWVAVACFGLLRIVVSLAQIRSLCRRSRELTEAEIDPLLRQTLNDFRTSRPATLCVSDELRVPTALGFISPAVIIPRWALEELSPGELNAVLLHELGHLGRWDDWTNLAQKIVRALLFFHPAVWWIDSRLALEREMACDDLVLARTSDARGYAQCLVSVAEKSLLRSGLALALAAVSRIRQTAVRLARILDPNRVSETRVSKSALAAVTAAGLLTLAALPYTPTLVEFTNAGQVAKLTEPSLLPASLFHQATLRQSSSRPPVVTAAAHTGQPRVVNAVLKVSVPADRKTQSPARTVRAHAKPQSSLPRVVRTSLNAERSASPILVYVVHTEEFDGAVWSVHVLRVVFTIDEKEVQAQNGTLAKSI